ncbi:H-NS histone family protein [Bradyrhizobium sp. F1.13.3]|uniref:H-NS histone family protein n=1 Tax=Bradyrhizobium sp. F1.13.3 TaxID=3156351 RepID=UPI00339B6072
MGLLRGKLFAPDGAIPRSFQSNRNPLNGSETWAGRGKQPRWVTNLLKSGKRIDDLRIDRTAT